MQRRCRAHGRRGTPRPAVAAGSTSPLTVLRQQCQRQRFQPALARDLGARLAFGLVRPIEILHCLERGRGVELSRELVGQLILRGDLGLDRVAALGQLAKIVQPGLDVPDLHLIQPAGDLFAVASDEGDRVAVVQERDGGGNLVQRNGQFCGDEGGDRWCSQKGTSVRKISDPVPGNCLQGQMPGKAKRSQHARATLPPNRGDYSIREQMWAKKSYWTQEQPRYTSFAAGENNTYTVGEVRAEDCMALHRRLNHAGPPAIDQSPIAGGFQPARAGRPGISGTLEGASLAPASERAAGGSPGRAASAPH